MIVMICLTSGQPAGPLTLLGAPREVRERIYDNRYFLLRLGVPSRGACREP